MYFANQVVNNAYAMHALLSILLNCDIIKIGSTLTEFKDFTKDFPSTIKGLSLSNSHTLRKSHNYVARSWPKQPKKKSAYQYISYIPFEGYLWELDGLKSGPLRLGPCTETNWLDRLQFELLRKTDRFQKQNMPYSMWSIIEDRRNVLQRKLVAKSNKTDKIETQLDEYYPEWRLMVDVQKWEEEYQYAMLNKHNVLGLDVAAHMTRHYQSRNDAIPSDPQCYDHDEFNFKDQMDTWLQTKDEILRIYNDLGKEEEKHQHYQCDTVRRQHDYDPFITAYLEALQSQGLLNQIITGST
ncbi:unnamed protein product [Absidia cylindrospora]